MSGRRAMATRTYLEMREPVQLRPAPLPDAAWRVERMLDCAPAFWRFLYTEIGREHHWVDRLPWSVRRNPGVPDGSRGVDLASDGGGSPAGYFELRRDADEGIEIAYFGLLSHFHGRGLGGHLLTQAVQPCLGGRRRRASGSTRTPSTILPRCRIT